MMKNPFHYHRLDQFLPKQITPFEHLDDVDSDFSAVFGPLPTQQAIAAAAAAAHDHHQNTVLNRVIQDFDGLSLNNGNVNDNAVVGLEDFEILKLVGRGSYGKVYQVRKFGSSEIFAMKVMRKDMIMEQNHAKRVNAERAILTKINHPFIVQLRYSFHNKHRVYLVLDFVNGGELLFQLKKEGLFLEDVARIYAAEIVSAVSYLHSKGIMHRDLKPANILMDAEGHAVLTDFGFAKQLESNNSRSNTYCGTVDYMAPEIIMGEDYDTSADWWSVGILLYEMLTGKLPFSGSGYKLEEKIMKEKLKMPSFLTSDAHSLLKGLLTKDASKRLGSNGAGESEGIKRHKWFRSINWKKLENREIRPGFVPKVSGKQCTANFKERLTKIPVEVESPATTPRCSTVDENPFQGFNYVRPPNQAQRASKDINPAPKKSAK